MKTFVAAVETGSFTAAAERLGHSPKLVSKYIGQLEERLDARLLHRTTRRLSLTSAGRRYYAKVTFLIQDLEELEHDVRNDVSGLSGTLRIAAPATFGELYVQPIVSEFQRDHPGLTIDLRLSDRYVDLADDGFDLAIRIGNLDASGMIARRLMKTELWVVASESYLKENPAPALPEDLSSHICIRDTNLRSGTAWPFKAEGQIKKIAVNGPFLVNSAKAVRDLVVAGKGIGLCPDYVVSPDVSAGRLIRVLPACHSVTLDIHAVFLDTRHMPAKVRSLLDYLVRRFKSAESWAALTR